MRPLFAFIVLCCMSVSTAAHDYWFEADSFFLKLSESTLIHLFVGQTLKKDEERPFQASKTNSFQMYSQGGIFDMRTMAEDGKSPLVNFSADHSGTFMLSMERSWSYIKLAPAEFETYLRDEGMGYVVTERKRLGESGKEGRERYSRYLKSFIQVGDSRTGNAKTRIGTKLEIVPLDNPYSKSVGKSISFQIWFDGRPLVDTTVFADNRDGENFASQKLTTDKDGIVSVRLDHKGIWLIRTVFMRRCERSCRDIDWESFWGSLSFGSK